MYFNVNFNVFFKLIKMHLLVSELHILSQELIIRQKRKDVTVTREYQEHKGMCHPLLFRPGTCNTGITFKAAYFAASPYLRNDCDLFKYKTKTDGVCNDATSNFYLSPSLYIFILYYYYYYYYYYYNVSL